jgi:hypothetical protein
MLRPLRSFLLLIFLIILVPACRAQSAPQHVRDYIYGPSGKLITTAEPDVYPPTDPMYMSASPGSCAIDGVDVQWDNSSTDIGSGVAGFQLYKNGSYMGTYTGDEYWDYSVSGGSSYTYAVNAVDHAGNQSDQISTEADVPLCTVRRFPFGLQSDGKRLSFAGLRLIGTQHSPSGSAWMASRYKLPTRLGRWTLPLPAPSIGFQVSSFDLAHFALPNRRPDISLIQRADFRGLYNPPGSPLSGSLAGGGR